MPDLQSAFYFSAVTYTTTGYGDLVLPTEFRLAGGVEALTGILMCGWSTGFFFAIVGPESLKRSPRGTPRECGIRGDPAQPYFVAACVFVPVLFAAEAAAIESPTLLFVLSVLRDRSAGGTP